MLLSQQNRVLFFLMLFFFLLSYSLINFSSTQKDDSRIDLCTFAFKNITGVQI